MTLLWAIFAVMALVGAAIIIIPVLRHQVKHEVSGEQVNALVYRDRMNELDAELQGKIISQEQYDQLKQELELTLLNDVQASAPDQGARSAAGKWVVWLLLVLVPLSGGVVYWSEGLNPDVRIWLSQQEKMDRVMPLMMAGNFEAAEKEGIQVQDFIRHLQKYLQTNTEDAQGWYLLGASYMQLQMPKQGELAFRRALNLEPANVDFQMGYTQASLAMSNGNLTPQILQTLRSIIQQQPNNPKPYMTWGMALFQNGDYEGAIRIWQQYLQREGVDPRAAQLLKRSIDVAQAELQKTPQTPSSPVSGAAGKPEIQVTVNVPETVKAQLSTNDILFVYAKATSGPPMPLAVVRQPVSGWPVTALLNDNNAMTPAMTISKFEEVVVQARISSSGNAIPQSGDWIGPTEVIKLTPGVQSVSLELNARMP